MEKTSQTSEQMKYLKQIYGLREVLVKTSLLQGDEPDFTVTEVDSFLTSLTSSKAKKKKINQPGTIALNLMVPGLPFSFQAISAMRLLLR